MDEAARQAARGRGPARGSSQPLSPAFSSSHSHVSYSSLPYREVCRQYEECGLLLYSGESKRVLEDATLLLFTHFPCTLGVIWANSDLAKQGVKPQRNSDIDGGVKE